jgi:hypothetical protein
MTEIPLTPTLSPEGRGDGRGVFEIWLLEFASSYHNISYNG